MIHIYPPTHTHTYPHHAVSPPLIDIYASQHGTVVALSIVLGLALLVAAGLGACCFWYRR